MAVGGAPTRFDRTVPANAEQVRRLRHAVVGLAADAGFDDDRRADIALAVGEACANVVVHAYRNGDEPGAMTVEAEVDERDRLRVVVADEGRGMAPRTDSPGLGLGLPLIGTLTDRLEIGEQPDGRGARLCMEFAPERPNHL